MFVSDSTGERDNRRVILREDIATGFFGSVHLPKVMQLIATHGSSVRLDNQQQVNDYIAEMQHLATEWIKNHQKG